MPQIFRMPNHPLGSWFVDPRVAGRSDGSFIDWSMKMITPGIDHIAMTVPDLDEQVERFTSSFGLIVEARFEGFALMTDPVSGLKLELGRSEDADVHFRHFGFRSDDVDRAHESLVEAGMETSEAPHRREFARMYTSFLKQPGGVEIQLVDYDDTIEEPTSK